MINLLRLKNSLSIALLTSILFFLRKGIQYAIIGSYIPLSIIIGIIILFIISIQISEKAFIYIVRAWAILLIIWSLFRTLMSILFLIGSGMDANHLTNQFDVYSLILSIIMLILGLILFFKRKYLLLKLSQ